MKSEHRHELKTNELAEWIGNFPTWAKENALTLIVTLVVLVGILVYFSWDQGTTVADEQNRADFTESLARLLVAKGGVVRGGPDADTVPLLMAADNLRGVASTSSSDGMAAFALIKRAEAFRASSLFSKEADFAAQIETAQNSYRAAQKRAMKHKSLLACATYGLGLCAEDLRHFDEAAQIYRDMVADPNLEGTALRASAAYRLKRMDHYRSPIVFKEAPEAVEAPPIANPIDETATTDSNVMPVTIPLDAPSLGDANAPAATPDTNTTE